MENYRQAANVMTVNQSRKGNPALIAPCAMNCRLCRANEDDNVQLAPRTDQMTAGKDLSVR